MTPAPSRPTEPSVTRGRPRSEAVDAAIRAATLRRLAIDGYQGLTLSGVADEAHVGRPSIYRRYGSKAELAADALLGLSAEGEVRLPDHPLDALRQLLGATAAALSSPGAMTIFGSMLVAERDDPELMEVFRRAVFEPRHRVVRGVVDDAVRRGLARRDLDPDIVIDLLFGSLLARAITGQAMDDADLDRVVDHAWAGIGVVHQ